MPRNVSLSWGVALLFLSATLAGLAGCQRSQSPQPAPPPASQQPYSNSFSASGWTYHLRPLKPGAPDDGDKAKGVWRELLQGMAKDTQTKDLLRRLHGDLPVELTVLDAKQAEDKAVLLAPPPEGAVVVLRVADISHKEEKSKTGSVPVRVIAYGRVVLVKDAASAGDWKEAPSPGEPLSLVLEDYVARHALAGPCAAARSWLPRTRTCPRARRSSAARWTRGSGAMRSVRRLIMTRSAGGDEGRDRRLFLLPPTGPAAAARPRSGRSLPPTNCRTIRQFCQAAARPCPWRSLPTSGKNVASCDIVGCTSAVDVQ